ncbi:unnamed protein product [Trichogramma brassicae]|uniref:Uncharacterized protein n=1 Tax=Trichogramma brassicae TaxID=86971 RepID=A0A6H5ISJ0_9HYME|nr:unnamed protein product [Trichogramma brassicae]
MAQENQKCLKELESIHEELNRDGYVKMAEVLLRNGADPIIADADGCTPLHNLSKRFYYNDEDYGQLTEILLKVSREKGYQVDIQDKLGQTPLHLAVRNHMVDETEVLLRCGADPNLADKEGLTPLHIISKNFDMRFLPDNHFLLKKFFKINDEMQQTIQIDAQDNEGRTPLQWAVGDLNPDVVDVLLDRGANLSNFVFPHGKDFCKEYNIINHAHWNKLKPASGALTVVERLEKRGYDLVRSDVMTVIEFFAKYELFEQSSDLEKWLHDDEEFTFEAKKVMINLSLSLHDLIQLPPEKASKQLTYTDYLKFARSYDLWKLSKSYQEACSMNLCEKMSRGFFRRWALDSILELTRYQLPILCCEIVIQKLKNDDLCNLRDEGE